MSPRDLLTQLGAGRIALGAALVARPRTATSMRSRGAAPPIYLLAGGALVAGLANLADSTPPQA